MSIARAAPVCAMALAALAVPRAAAGQGSTFEVVYGAWFADDDTSSRVLHAGVGRRLLGPLGWGLGFAHVQDTRDSLPRTFSGGEFSLSLWRDGSGPYVLASTGFGVRHGGGTDLFWTAGAGYQLRVLSLFTLGVEARYRAEDTRMHGFWNLGPADRQGVQVGGRLSFGIGGPPTVSRERGAVPATGSSSPAAAFPAPPADTGTAGTAPHSPLPPETDPFAIAVASGASEEAARLTASVVETALASMGSPYQWGGTDANGFDCSGLIQFAYAKHGVLLPRVSRDQARMGQVVSRDLAALRPGDILAFSTAGTSSQVTHVGLYVGSGQFIHSSRNGVKLSQLEAGDGDSRWWRERWVGARRIVE
jgi:cell wall-associated NlpC family hydrolase